MNRTCMLVDLKKNMYHDRESITIAVPYPFSNLKKLSGFSIQYLHEEGPWGTWNIVLFYSTDKMFARIRRAQVSVS